MSGPADDPRPSPPREPGLEECCNSGCERCILDLYAEALAGYERELRAWKLRHPGETAGGQNT